MSLTILKGGFRTMDRRLDRIPEHDPKSTQYRVKDAVVRGIKVEDREICSKLWALDTWLDQGQEGRCVEFGICHDLLAEPEPVLADPFVDGILANRRIYWPAQREDAFPGGSYPGADPQSEGTSVLAGMKVAKELGFYGEYRWALTLNGALRGMSHLGPLILGVNWYEEMGDPDGDGYLHVDGEQTGGHCILAIGHHIVAVEGFEGVIKDTNQIDMEQSYIILHNSWGQGWGENGRAKLSIPDFDRLRKEDGEVCIASERCTPTALPEEA